MFSIVGILRKLFQTMVTSIFRHTKRVKNAKYILRKVGVLNFQRCKTSYIVTFQMLNDI